jgi:hypothetical protein
VWDFQARHGLLQRRSESGNWALPGGTMYLSPDFHASLLENSDNQVELSDAPTSRLNLAN